MDRARPRQRQWPPADHACLRGFGARTRCWSTASRCPRPSRRSCGAIISRAGSSPRTPTRRAARPCSTTLPEGLPRVISVGRLDFNSEGLLLLTNDGALARHLELPATGWLRRYRVRAHGRVSQADLDKLKDGIEIEGVRYGPIEASLDSVQGANAWITMGLREGKNREVRRILAHLGVDVNRLIRISYGPFQLLDLKPGEAEPVKRHVLSDQLGARLAAELNLNEPVEEERARRKARNAKRGGDA